MAGDPLAAGVLYVVATPIGNRDDISARALEVLGRVGIIAAEDTRHSALLLAGCGIDGTRLLSLHDHNEAERVPQLIERLRGGADVALVSDAGTPLVSDPGFRLVAAAHDAGIRVSPVPGPCAAIAALSAAGIAADRFFFEGFLPATTAARRARLAELATQRGALVFHEAPHRVADTLVDMADVLGGDRPATIAREISKRFETIRRATLETLAGWVAVDHDQQRGEIVLVVGGATRAAGLVLDEDRLLTALAAEMPASAASRVAASVLGGNRRSWYRRLQELGADGAE